MEHNIANFILPGFCEHYHLYRYILDYLDIHKEMYNEKAYIYGFYGNFPFCTWDGGRIFHEYTPASVEKMEEILDFYNNKHQKIIRFVYTNSLLKEEDLYDRYNNIATDIFNRNNNEIVLNSELLYNYISNKYTNYNFISSTTKCILDINEIKEELNNDKYLMVCLDYNLNHNYQLFNNLSDREKDKVELLVNPHCGPACQFRKEHYKLNSISSLNYGKLYNMRGCNIDNNNIFWPRNWNTQIDENEIFDYYLKNGFHFFKLEGRTWTDYTLLLTIAKYIIKSEYQFAFIEGILEQLNGRS